MNIEELIKELESSFPDYEFRTGKRIYGKCIIAKKNRYSGADLFIKQEKIIIESAIPEMKTRLLLGAGAVLLRFFKKDYHEPRDTISEYLFNKGHKISIKE